MSDVHKKINFLPPLQCIQNFPYVDESINAINNWQLMEKMWSKINEVIKYSDINVNYIDNLLIFNTVQNMKENEYLKEGDYCYTCGFNSISDGGSSLYKIRQITNTDIVNNMSIISLNNSDLIAEFISDDTIKPAQFGAFGDGTHDDYKIIQYAVDNYKNVNLDGKRYYISQAIQLRSNQIIRGNKATIISNNNQYAFEIGNINNLTTHTSIRDITIDCTSKNGYGIKIQETYNIAIENIVITRLQTENAIGIDISNSFNNYIKDCIIHGNQSKGQIGINVYSIAGSGQSNQTNNNYENILIQLCEYGFKANYNQGANTIICNNFGFSACKYNFYVAGNVLPIEISNFRMEKSVSNEEILYGFYFEGNVLANIKTGNAYNIPIFLHNTSNYPTLLEGQIELNGTQQSNKYLFADSDTISSKIINNANIDVDTNVYSTNTNGSIPSACTFASDATAGTLQLDTRGIVRKITATVSNSYGQKGSYAYIWTDQEGISLRGNNTSQTHKWTNDVVLTPYRLYKVFMIEQNQAIISI